MRPRPGELGIQLRFLLDQYKTEHFNQYKYRLRPYALAVSLFYAQHVVLKLDRNVRVSALATSEIEALGGNVHVGANDHQGIEFNQRDCPFAVVLKPVHTY